MKKLINFEKTEKFENRKQEKQSFLLVFLFSFLKKKVKTSTKTKNIFKQQQQKLNKSSQRQQQKLNKYARKQQHNLKTPKEDSNTNPKKRRQKKTCLQNFLVGCISDCIKTRYRSKIEVPQQALDPQAAQALRVQGAGVRDQKPHVRQVQTCVDKNDDRMIIHFFLFLSGGTSCFFLLLRILFFFPLKTRFVGYVFVLFFFQVEFLGLAVFVLGFIFDVQVLFGIWMDFLGFNKQI